MPKSFRAIKGYIQDVFYVLHPLTVNIHPKVRKHWVVHRTMVSQSGRYCYFRIPKSANSTIARSLAYYDPNILYDPLQDLRGKSAKKSARLLSAGALTLAGLYEKYFLFTFVRNPYSRLLSAFMDKIFKLDNAAFESTRQVVRSFSDTKHDLTFESFIHYLEKRGLYENPHWVPQMAMLPLAVEKLHFIGRVENLDDDLNFVVNRLFGEGVYKGPVIREVNRTNSAHKLAQYYDGNLSERVYALYKADFDAFSYARDLPS